MSAPTDPIAYLRRVREAGQHNDVVQMIRDRDSAITRWGRVFASPSRLTPEDLSDFLQFEHNRHWWGLQRRSDILLRRFEAVREMISELLDEDRPIVERIDGLGEPREFDREIWSPILLVTHPDTHGVWNQISESAMRRLGLWPDGTDGASPGTVYGMVDEMLNLTAAEVGVDLWTLDALWWAVEKEHDASRYFVTRSKPARVATRARTAAPARTKTLRAAKAKAVVAEDTFVCQRCWMTKQSRLASDEAGVCIDCA
ncbi:MAG TPA: hypothetical protein VLB67_14485 [Acidimicrobiia bacterium]|nr:hypothetical protein [Acidimicrobiia bacterium]